MRIDRTHKSWLWVTLALMVLSAAAYILFSVRGAYGPRGRTVAGLAFGIAGYGMMLFAGLLGARKHWPILRIGRTQWWMRGHLWLGTLSLALILFHGEFTFRGPLTALLMTLLFIVVVSGWVGAAIQHFVPKMMTTRVPMETIYEEIPHVREQLRMEADRLVETICGPLDGGISAEFVLPGQPSGSSTVSTLVDIEVTDRAHFREVYLRKVRPFLENPDKPGMELANPQRAIEVFESLRRLLVAPVHGILDDLQNICEEENQLRRQIWMYRLLHGWLLLHVPLSIALLALGAIHMVMALRY